jgi:DNA-binding transcriptional ArsR family regulator
MPNTDPALLARTLGDPLRFAMLVKLMDGPATVSQFVSATGESPSNTSNHLAILRDSGLVRATRSGRQMIYRLANPSVAQIVESLVSVSGTAARRPGRYDPVAVARTCYGHLAGELGVKLFDALVARGDIVMPHAETGDVRIQPRSFERLALLGVDVQRLQSTRRKQAFACPDWTERRPHVGGALGAELCRAFLALRWISRTPGSRALTVTTKGVRAFKLDFGIELREPVRTRSIPRAGASTVRRKKEP